MHLDEPAVSPIPEIPAKRYFTISEVSTICDVKPHVLRYWEQEFTALRPSKRRGNRRYYRREDVLIVSQIKALLYEQGYTISGARVQLASQRVAQLQEAKSAPLVVVQDTPIPAAAKAQPQHLSLIQDLQEVLKILS